MTNAEIIATIRSEIERLYDGEAPKHDQQCDFDDGYFTGIGAIAQFLDSIEPEKPVPADLEKAAKNYAMRDKWTYEHFGDVVMKAVFFGAKWQAEQDKGTIELAEDHAFLAGAVNEREKMLKEAVEADVNIYRDLAEGESWAEFVVAKPPKNLGDKVRIIIVKEDGK